MSVFYTQSAQGSWVKLRRHIIYYPLAANLTLMAALTITARLIKVGRLVKGRFDNDIYSGNAGVQFVHIRSLFAFNKEIVAMTILIICVSRALFIWITRFNIVTLTSPKENSRRFGNNLDMTTFWLARAKFNDPLCTGARCKLLRR